jgi:uncharacterized membrane protein YheB (UPF0754 family)
MAFSVDWLRAALTIFFGALAGGVTNRIAVWMLFHPYEPPSVAGRRVRWLQGAVPKNQKRLASSIGRVVGGQLLTSEDIAAELRDEELRDAFQTRLRELIVALVEGDQPALADLLPPSALEELRALAEHVLDEGREQIQKAVESPEFQTEAERLLDHVRQTLSDEPLSTALDEERLDAVRDSLDEWLARLANSEAFEQTVNRHLEGAANHVLAPGRTLEELIPQGLVAAVEHAINDYLPLAMERLGRLLEDPEARHRVERLIHDLLDRFMRDLRFHQRVVAKLIITEETVTKVLETLEAEGADRLGDLLKEEEVQGAMARNVNEAISEFLRRPTTSVLGEVDAPQVLSALAAIQGWILQSARDEKARRFFLEQLEDAVARLGERSWADLLRLVPASRIGPWLAAGLRSEPGQEVFDSITATLVERLLHRPIGRLNRFLREDAAVRLSDSLAPPAWEWVTGQVPEVAERIRIAERIEEKIEGFPLVEVERLVREISQRELDLIIRLGYILGAFIGTILVIITTILG